MGRRPDGVVGFGILAKETASVIRNALSSGRTVLLAVALAVGLSACGINNVPTYDEEVKAAWSEVQNQYQRRADLVPNLVETVKGYANQEQETLTRVIEARAKATQMQLPSDITENPEAFQRFQENQQQLSSALARLMVVVERYPDLKSNQNFLALQSQLEGTENRITIARRDYIQAVQKYNTELRTIPGRWVAGIFYPDAEVKQTFTANEQAQSAPQVNFQ
jgi:LemA protein